MPLVLMFVAILLLAGALWYLYSNSQQHIQQLESRSRTSADQAQQAEQKAQQALDALQEQRDMLGALRAELRESRAELDDLGSAFQTITDRGSDLVLLNDVDHLVMIAQQQLQLNGNVANAIISLETAQAQLARANRPALASLLQTINGDLDRLRAASTVDIALLSARLDQLGGLVSQAPLLIPDDAVTGTDRPARQPWPSTPSQRQGTEGADTDPWWQNALTRTQQWTSDAFNSLRHDLGQFVSVRRVDDAAALLISPDQATRFRDTLRQRIMTAQLALMMDQSLIWETETDALLKAIESRFDPQSSVTRQAVRIAREVADTAIDAPLPDVSNSIKALEAASEQMGRRDMPEQGAPNQVQESTSDTPMQPSSQDAEQPSDDASEPGPAAADDASQPGPAAADDVADESEVQQG